MVCVPPAVNRADEPAAPLKLATVSVAGAAPPFRVMIWLPTAETSARVAAPFVDARVIDKASAVIL